VIRAAFISARALKRYRPFNVWKAGFWLLVDWLRVFVPSNRRLRKARLAVCKECQLFSHVDRTCGHMRSVTGQKADDIENGAAWVHPLTGVIEPLGCGCLLDVKALIQSATCYLRDAGADVGWPDNLNGREH